jgi:hypothetical protein
MHACFCWQLSKLNLNNDSHRFPVSTSHCKAHPHLVTVKPVASSCDRATAVAASRWPRSRRPSPYAKAVDVSEASGRLTRLAMLRSTRPAASCASACNCSDRNPGAPDPSGSALALSLAKYALAAQQTFGCMADLSGQSQYVSAHATCPCILPLVQKGPEFSTG